MSNIGERFWLYMVLKSLQGKDISNLTIILGTCKECKHNKKDECDLGHRNKFREPSTFCCMDFIKKEDE